jgi:topoisomerase-4 subunit B
MRQGLLDGLREYLKIQGQEGKEKVALEDLTTGLNYLLSIKMIDPNFIGQTKEKLSSPELSQPLFMRVKNAFLGWLLKHHSQAMALKKFVDENKSTRLAHQKTLEIKKYTVSKFPVKLADCTTKNFQQREIFLVEGDSAGSSAKQARDKKTQAILPLRGKILNSWEVKPHKVLESQEVRDIVTTLGVSIQSSDLSGLRYNRVCLLADADSDGSHIMTLLCALFYKHFPYLVQAGHLYIAKPPLYRIDIGKNHYYAQDLEEKAMYEKKYAGKNLSVIRFKGLGEMNPEQLRETTLAPESRSLIKLYPEESSNEILDMLMGKKRAQDRKKWLETPVEFEEKTDREVC